MSESGQYAGATAGLSMLLILITAVGYVRRRQYELFYIVHVVLVAVILATGKSASRTSSYLIADAPQLAFTHTNHWTSRQGR